jgi:hypothetical protein
MKLARIFLIISSAVLGFAGAAHCASFISASVEVGGQVIKTNAGSQSFCGLNGCRNAEFGIPDDPTSVQEIDLELDPGGLQVEDAVAVGHATAHAAIGDLGVSVLGSSAATSGTSGRPPIESFATSSAQGVAVWEDRIKLSTTRIPFGRTLRATSAIFLNGDLNASTTGQGIAGANLLITPTNNPDGNAISFPTAPYANGSYGNVQVGPVPGFNFSNPVPGAFRVTLTVSNNTPATMGIQIQLSGNSRSDIDLAGQDPGSGTYSANVTGSLHWGGIESVTDEFGNPIDDWSVTSDSGFDYSKPFGVPEPASCVLLLSGMLGFARGRRRWH